jgi:PhnB protein
MSTLPPVPADQPSVMPHLIVKHAARAIAFYTSAFGARELFRLTEPGGKVGHAELAFGTARIGLADEYPDFGALSPASVGGTPVSIHLYVADVDLVVARAVAEGATLLRPIRDEFYGDRVGMLADPFGHKWQLASRREEVAPAEMQRRFTALFA